MLVAGCYTKNIGFLRDISEEGLRFEYRGGQFSEDCWTKINILQADKRHVLLSTVSCRIVYNIKDLVEDHTFNGAETSHCGLKFIDITAEQKSLLRQIVESRHSPGKQQ